MSDILRITGMVSGMDTDDMVKKLVSLQQAKVDKVNQDKQYTQWKQEAYREVSNLLRGFKDEYFDYLNSDTNMRSSKTLTSYQVTFDGEDTSNYLNIDATRESTLQNYAITSIVTAKKAEVAGSSLSSEMQGVAVTDFNINSLSDNNKITINFNGITREITIDDNPGDLVGLQANLQQKIDDAFGLNEDGSKKISISTDVDDSLIFDTDDTNTLSIDYAYNTGAQELFGQDLSTGLTLDTQNNKFKLTVTDTDTGVETTNTIELTVGNDLSINDIVADMQSKIDTAFGDGSLESSNIQVIISAGRIQLQSTVDTQSLSVGYQENGGLEAIGFSGSDINKANKIDLTANIADIAKHFAQNFAGTDIDSDGYDIEFTINGEAFQFDSAITSLQDIMSEVNSNENANAFMEYDTFNDRLLIKTKDTGVTAELVINDETNEGNLMTVLGFNNTDLQGSDASITFDDGSPEGLTIQRASNTFTFDGLSFELKQDVSNINMDIEITVDPTDTFDLIVGFVDKYNEVISKINEEISEKRYFDYKPLTESQKEEMSDKEIELWEEKAKNGILRSDSILQNLASEMRMSLYETVEGAGINLYDMGITTSKEYLDGGKLEIDEEKLTNALRDNPEAVNSLFTQSGDTTETKGLAQRLYDIIEANIRTTRDESGRKGLLLEKAGIEGDASQLKNLLTEQIDDYDNRLQDLVDAMAEKEEYYYNMFAKMESALSRMNNQSSWLVSQFSGGSQ